MRFALAILNLISLFALTYFALLHSLLMSSVHNGAAYKNCGIIAQFYIVFSASCLSPQFILANIDKAVINFLHLSVMYFMCSVYLNLLSIIMPMYIILSTCSRCLLFRCISIAFLYLCLLDINITFDFLALEI